MEFIIISGIQRCIRIDVVWAPSTLRPKLYLLGQRNNAGHLLAKPKEATQNLQYLDRGTLTFASSPPAVPVRPASPHHPLVVPFMQQSGTGDATNPLGTSTLCIAGLSATVQPGGTTSVIAAPCRNTTNQIITYDSFDQTLRIYPLQSESLCLTAQSTLSAGVSVGDCIPGSITQQWTLVGSSIQHVASGYDVAAHGSARQMTLETTGTAFTIFQPFGEDDLQWKSLAIDAFSSFCTSSTIQTRTLEDRDVLWQSTTLSPS